ncbi:MAG: 50S ribosomal protein L32 [Bacteriovoracaceae bacterium]|nr:50S ribosomal protein L32 [Bacteriovoracaceae bacterium]
MAVPKKKTSVSRKGLRHAGHTHKLTGKGVMKCPNCSAITLPHHACASCGQYKGRVVIKMKVKTTETGVESNNDQT